jgi:riboflavin synthase
MFTGIIESVNKVKLIESEGSNLNLCLHSDITAELTVDQSIAHNGVCLTVTQIEDQAYWVTAVEETLEKSNIGELNTGSLVNIERCVKASDRLDGHIVQGHVDTVGYVRSIEQREGSWMYYFAFDSIHSNLIVPKGSICINGVSLTIVEAGNDYFSVTIIPYTYEHTNFKTFKEGHAVNLEFDIIGKYVQRYQEQVRYNKRNSSQD